MRRSVVTSGGGLARLLPEPGAMRVLVVGSLGDFADRVGPREAVIADTAVGGGLMLGFAVPAVTRWADRTRTAEAELVEPGDRRGWAAASVAADVQPHRADA